jgi:hypothetical protein
MAPSDGLGSSPNVSTKNKKDLVEWKSYHIFVEVLWKIKNIDSGSPHSTDVDNPEWNRKTAPTAEAS